ncbi:MAG: 3'(2'),5'-bisphosphate nucleotidase CysQ [Tolumonas sp.]
MLNDELITALLKIADDAGQAILAVYDEPVELTVKADESPLTQADRASHQLIEQRLQALTPQWPVVSEESDDSLKAQRTRFSVYWLVDPLDGTKEFIKRNGEFTVNIALIVDGCAVFGVVGVPVQNKLYWGGKEYGCWLKDSLGTVRLTGTASKPALLRVVGSRSHVNAETAEYLKNLGDHELVSVGSSLKFCLLAEGKADLYPRLGPTCEWDTAAAQAVLEGAGGKVETLDGQPLRYSKPDILNPWFVASV